jgi:hypothetical protein
VFLLQVWIMKVCHQDLKVLLGHQTFLHQLEHFITLLLSVL